MIKLDGGTEDIALRAAVEFDQATPSRSPVRGTPIYPPTVHYSCDPLYDVELKINIPSVVQTVSALDAAHCVWVVVHVLEYVIRIDFCTVVQ